MKTGKNKLHRGRVLATVVEASRLSKEEIIEKVGYSRSAYYKHIDNSDLEFRILAAYGRALRHDFTEEFPDMPAYFVEDIDEPYGKTLTIEEATWQRDYWKDKYIGLLEKYNKLIEGRNK